MKLKNLFNKKEKEEKDPQEPLLEREEDIDFDDEFLFI